MPSIHCNCLNQEAHVQVAMPRKPTKCDKIVKVVSAIFTLVIAVALFSVAAPFFAVGFIVGAVFHKQIREGIEKIKKIWEMQPFITTALIVVGAIFAAQITLAAASFMYAAHIGSKLAEEALKQKKA